MSDKPKVRITGNGLPASTRIYIGDMEISHLVTSVDLHIAVGEVTRAEIGIIGDVEMSAELEQELVEFAA